jgi:hypothetical protein
LPKEVTAFWFAETVNNAADLTQEGQAVSSAQSNSNEDHSRSSDDLYRRAKSEAALRGRKLKDLIEEGLRLVLETPRETQRRQSLAGLIKRARGAVDSSIADLASNPEHFEGFGRDGSRHC